MGAHTATEGQGDLLEAVVADDADDATDIDYLRRTDAPATQGVSTIDIVDLFSGCGGLTFGAIEGAARGDRNARLALAIDNDALALGVLRETLGGDEKHYVTADVQDHMAGLYEPVCDAERELFKNGIGATLLLAGPPCQGHSSLNNHTRHDDERNDLYLKVARAAKIIQPRAVVAENVRGVRSDRRAAMTTCVAALEEIGYSVVSRRVDLHRIGVPQTRVRHVLVATKDRRFRWSLPDASSRTVEWAIHDLLDVEGLGVLNTATKPTKKNRKRIEYLFKQDQYDLPNPLRPRCHRDDHSYGSMYGRLKWDAPAQTITSGFGSMGQGRYVHPLRERTLTPHEAARLQFLPDFVDFDTVNHRTALSRMIGNVAPPRLTIAVVQALIEQQLL